MSKRNTSSIYFDGSFDCFSSIRKFVGDANIHVIQISWVPKNSWVTISNDLCNVVVASGDTIIKDEHGAFKVKKKRKSKQYAGDL